MSRSMSFFLALLLHPFSLIHPCVMASHIRSSQHGRLKIHFYSIWNTESGWLGTSFKNAGQGLASQEGACLQLCLTTEKHLTSQATRGSSQRAICAELSTNQMNDCCKPGLLLHAPVSEAAASDAHLTAKLD